MEQENPELIDVKQSAPRCIDRRRKSSKHLTSRQDVNLLQTRGPFASSKTVDKIHPLVQLIIICVRAMFLSQQYVNRKTKGALAELTTSRARFNSNIALFLASVSTLITQDEHERIIEILYL